MPDDTQRMIQRLREAADDLRESLEPEGPSGPRIDSDGIDAAEDLLGMVDEFLAKHGS